MNWLNKDGWSGFKRLFIWICKAVHPVREPGDLYNPLLEGGWSNIAKQVIWVIRFAKQVIRMICFLKSDDARNRKLHPLRVFLAPSLTNNCSIFIFFHSITLFKFIFYSWFCNNFVSVNIWATVRFVGLSKCAIFAHTVSSQPYNGQPKPIFHWD